MNLKMNSFEPKPILRRDKPFCRFGNLCLSFIYFISSQLQAQPDAIEQLTQPPDSVFSTVAFIENKGQWPSKVKFQLQSINETVWMTDEGIRFNIFETFPQSKERLDKASHYSPECQIHGHVFELIFTGNAGTYIASEKNKKSTYFNYLNGKDPEKWVRHAGLYTEILQENVWEGIHLRYYINEYSKLEYDFIIEPESELSQLNFRLSGLDSLWIDRNGALILETTFGELTISPPITYQIVDGAKKYLKSEYVFKEDGTIGFYFPDGYDRSLQTVIDPVLQWATFLHSYWSNDYIYGLDTDNNNNAVVCGYTKAFDFPVTPGSYDATYNNLEDCFISKLTSDGSSLQFSTFLGGTGNERAYSIALDSEDNPVLTGYTSSSDFPVTPGAYDAQNNLIDGFISKLSADGTTLLFSTFIGGSEEDLSTDIQLDDNNNPIITGYTLSTNFPVTPITFDPNANGNEDAFISKLSADGSSLLYSTYIGGEGFDYGISIALDNAGNPFITGQTTSLSFPTTIGAFDQTLNGYVDEFVTGINLMTSTPFFSTFLGGHLGDVPSSIILDPLRNPLICGTTYSNDFPVTPGAYDQILTDTIEGDAVVTKLSADGSSILFSTFLGGIKADVARDVYLDGNWDILVLGETKSINFPTTNDAFDNSYNGEFDVFINKLSSDGSLLLYSSFYGGDESDYPRYGDIVADQNCVLFITTTHSANIPTTPGAYQENKLNSGQDTPMVIKFCDLITPVTDCPAGNIPPVTSQNLVCYNGNPISLENLPINSQPPGTVISWHSAMPPDSSNQMSNVSSLGPGTYYATFYDSVNNCYSPASVVPIYASPVAAFDYSNMCESTPVLFSDYSVSTSGSITEWNWNLGDGSFSDEQNPSHQYSGDSSYSVTLVVYSAFGCSDTINQAITLTEDPIANFNYNLSDPNFTQLEFQFNNTSVNASDYYWSFGGLDNSTLTNPLFTFPSGDGTYTIVLIASSGTCSDTATSTITIKDPLTYHIPNIFTPDADGINDVFTINTHGATDVEATIINRWGEQVTVLSGITSQWDGSINGEPASEGIYFVKYTITDTKAIETTGQSFVYLIRK